MPSLPEQAGPNAEIGSPMMHPSRRPVALYKKYTRYEPKDAKDGCTMEARHAFPGVFSLSSQRGDRKPLITSRMLGNFFGVWEQGRKEGREERSPLFASPAASVAVGANLERALLLRFPHATVTCFALRCYPAWQEERPLAHKTCCK